MRENTKKIDKETYFKLNIPANFNFGMDDIFKNLDNVDVLSDDNENSVFFSDNDITARGTQYKTGAPTAAKKTRI